MAAMSGSSKNDALYISLLGLAENFRVSNPPNIRLCIHCLQSIFNINPPPLIVSRTHLQLGNILLAHTKNKELATRHLEQAVSQICIANLSFVQIGPDIFFFYFCKVRGRSDQLADRLNFTELVSKLNVFICSLKTLSCSIFV